MTINVNPYRKNVLSNAGANALGSIVQFVLVFLLVHWLPVHEFATYITIVAIVAVGEMLSDFGLRIWAQRHFAIQSEAASPFAIASATKIMFSLLFGTILIAYPWHGMDKWQVSIAVLIAITQPPSDPILWFLRGKERLDVEAAVLIGWRFFNAIAILLSVALGKGIDGILFTWLLVNILRLSVEASFNLISPLWRQARQTPLALGDIYEAARQVMPIGLSFVLLSLYHRLGVFLIGEYGTPTDVALFGAVFTLVASAGFIATSITVAGFSPLSRAIETNNLAEATVISYRKIRLISLVFFPSCLIGMFVGPGVIGLLYPANYFPAGEAIPLLLAALFLSTINLALKYILNALKYNWQDAASASFGIATFVAIYILPTWHSHPVGAAFAWCMAESVVFLLKLITLHRDKRLSLPILRSSAGAYLLLLSVAWTATSPVMAFYQEHLF